MKQSQKLQTIKRSIAILLILVVEFTNPTMVAVAQEASASAAQTLNTTGLLEGLTLVNNSTISSVLQATFPSPTPADVPQAFIEEGIQKDSVVSPDTFTPLDIDAVSVTSATKRTPARLRSLSQKIYQSTQKVKVTVNTPSGDEFITTIIDPQGKTVQLDSEKVSGVDTTIVYILPDGHIRPGKYTIQITDTITHETTEQDFTWGVLAFNTDRSIYLPQQTANIAMAVLDEKGMMVCDASVTLNIKNVELGIDDVLSTDNGKIQVNDECFVKDITLKPDYEAKYHVGEAGSYEVTLSAETKNGKFSISDSFQVQNTVAFDVLRNSATRIYPAKKYPVTLEVTAHEDFEGTIHEIVPGNFEISPLETFEGGSVTTEEKMSEIPGLEFVNKKTAKKDTSALAFAKVTTVSSKTLENQNVLGAAVSLALPYDGEHQESLGFGEQLTDSGLKKKYADFGLLGHDGIDFDMPVGTPVSSVDDGHIVLVQENGDYGNTVVVQHSWGKSYYGHLSKFLSTKNQEVKKGETIALSGNSGLSTGPHLHFGIKPNKHDKDNGFYGKMDPSKLLGLDNGEKVLAAATQNTATQQVQDISWEVKLKKGDKIKIGYTYKAPEESPQFYTLGPAIFYNKAQKEVFREERQWQIASDLVVDNGDGLLVYGESANTTPRLRTYTNSSNSFTSESGTVSSTTGLAFIARTSPTKQEAIVGHISIDGSNNQILQVSCYDGTSWSNEWSVTVGTGAAPLTRRQFDIAYETNSGDVMVAYSRNATATNAVDYRTKLGSTGCGTGNWAGAASFPTSTTLTSANVHWVKLASDRRSSSNLIAAIWADSAQDLGASIWSGSAWGQLPSAALDTSLEIISAGQDIQSFDVEYESSSGDVMVVWGRSGTNATNLVFYKECTGGTSSCTWQTTGNIGTISDGASSLDISANPTSSSNEIVFGGIEDTTRDLSLAYWSGSAWTGTANVDTQAQSTLAGTKLITTGWFTNGSTTRSFVTYADNEGGGGGTDQTDIGYATGNGSTFTLSGTDLTPSPVPAIPQKWWDAHMDPFNRGQLMLTLSDNGSDLFVKRISMDSAAAVTISNPDSAGSFETSLSQATIGAFSFAYWRNYWTTLTQRQGIVENDQNGTNLTTHTAQIGERMKVKIQVDTDAGASRNKVLKLQYDKNDSSWVDVKPSGEIRSALSVAAEGKTKVGSGDAGSCTSGTSAKTGYFYEDRAVTDALLLKGSGCYDLTFAVDTKNASANTTYRFRLYNVTDNTTLSLGASPYASFTTVTSGNNTKRYSATNTTTLPSGSTSTAYSDLKNMLDKAGYDNVNSDDATREILQNVTSDTTADITPVGEATGNSLGISVSSAGDFNGDGFTDVIIGAHAYNSSQGRAYVYFGGTIPDATADITLTGETSTTGQFGYSVSTAGDVNGDGYSDIIVGAPLSSTNKAYIFYGSASPSSSISASSANLTLSGEVSNNNFGYSVSSAGDVNGDGYSEVIVGARSYNSGQGRAYIYYGNASMDSTVDVTLTGETGSTDFGNSVSHAGDVNGDGFADVIVGAALYTTNTGRAYLFYGSSSMSTAIGAASASLILTGAATNTQFGWSVSPAGDVNGDGFSDVIVGAPQYTTNTGRAYIFHGGSAMNNGIDVTLTGEATNNSFGKSARSAGDVNGDGYSDVIIGADGNGSSNTGKMYVYYGGSTMDTTADVTQTGEATSNSYGFSVAGAGDMNGDGFPDLIVGATGNNSSTGKAYIYYQSYSANTTADKTFGGDENGASFGININSSGDVNGDGYTDILVAADGHNGGGTDRGRVYLYYGGPSFDTTIDVTLTGDEDSGFFGSGVAGGDINGDGFSDILVGASLHDGGGGASANRGRAYIFYGSSSLSSAISATNANVVFNNELGGSFLGSEVATGDLNGDGYVDAIIAADQNSGAQSVSGNVYVFYGSSSPSSTYDVSSANVIFQGDETSGAMGSALSTGDLNGDSTTDVIVGASGHNGGGTDRGRAYIYYGSSSLTGTITTGNANLTITGDENSANLGNNVSATGDINGDGYADALIGAPNHNAGATDRGQAYIFYGGSSMNNTVDVTLSGDEDSASFGSGTAIADVNGDGYADAISGAYLHNGAGTDFGRAYVFYGGLTLSSALSVSNANLTLSGDEGSSNFGFRNFATDITNDGYADVLVGAYGHDDGAGAAANQGRMYTYIGGSSTYYPVYNFASKSASSCSGLTSIAATWGGQSNTMPAVVSDGFYSQLSVGAHVLYGGTGTSSEFDQALGQSFTASSSYSLTKVELYMAKQSSPADNVYAEILSGSTNGTVLGTSSNVSGTSISTSSSWVSFNFSSSIPLTSGTKYYIRLNRTGVRDTTNNYTWNLISSTDPYSGGGFFLKNNNTWSNDSTSDDANFKVYAVSTTKLQVYRFGSTNAWEDLASDTSSSANTDFTLTQTISSSLSEYCDGSNWAYFRVYQDIGTQSLQTDNFTATFTSGGVETPTLDQLMRHGRWFNSSGAVQPFTF